MTLVFCPTHRYAEMLSKETCTWSLYKICSFKTIGTDILPTIQRYLLELLVTFGGDSSCEHWQKWYDDLLTWFYSHQLVLFFVHCQLQWCGLPIVGFMMQHQQDLQCSGICITIWPFTVDICLGRGFLKEACFTYLQAGKWSTWKCISAFVVQFLYNPWGYF
jgi:hypothetical protein